MREEFSTDALFKVREYIIVTRGMDMGRDPDFTRSLLRDECAADPTLIADKRARFIDLGAKWIRTTVDADGHIWIEAWK